MTRLAADWIVVDWDHARAKAARNGAAFARGSVLRIRTEHGTEYELCVGESIDLDAMVKFGLRIVGYRAAMPGGAAK